MNNLINWLQNSFSPKMNKINNNVWVVSIKDSIMQTLPFIFLGSVFCLLAILNDYFPNLPSFWTPFGWTMGKISLFVAFLIPFNLMEKKRLRKQRLIAGMSSLILFLIVVTPQVEFDKVIGFGHTSLGAGGMFIAIFCGIFTGYVMSLFGKFSFFKEDSVIPDFVRSWFDAMLPIAIIICTGWIVVLIMKVDLYNAVLSIFMPLSTFIQSPFGFIIVMFIYCFLYSMGISSWVLTPVTSPVFLAAITANIAMAQAGTATAANLNLATSSTIYSAYLWVGGIGCTLPLVIMLIRSKAKKLSALGKACLVPSIFNINEPVVFGTIAWNPYLMIPMWIQGIVLPIVTYIFTKVIPFAPIPTLQFEMWYCPFPISTWITTGSISGILLLVVNIVISATIWYPFFKAYEAQEIKALNEQEAAN
ncbi:PTS system cellobiose-specific IIC component [Clostridium saccharoperbutylacetonicum]|uniref:Permease IIC component n=1 Tax=Clostridium saccharoperbutylacetonicum N1-4(HMT) TaxID=931276 RepID=M1ML54_9CLOT|nr:PTS transporter subunit EIIC [Clostridium saccharoperbutylacetonicum]AGF55531.1 cellobiose permease IIC component CelB [Clostridium saccharoperbutylacetonicum N1-4(HMT)]NRT63750.1 PTS system cellobiose-specific IIC component [Clostridium saccharoperbutylacetonicum]NSB27113.1 PTS system cellobiose-specific IIC component [Clostridium saccharoperbutylacetonicum]NSB40598.1 PTS system cellobiose-specific IIC component [Clostridium saccharoperbutylacetonicum]